MRQSNIALTALFFTQAVAQLLGNSSSTGNQMDINADESLDRAIFVAAFLTAVSYLSWALMFVIHAQNPNKATQAANAESDKLVAHDQTVEEEGDSFGTNYRACSESAEDVVGVRSPHSEASHDSTILDDVDLIGETTDKDCMVSTPEEQLGGDAPKKKEKVAEKAAQTGITTATAASQPTPQLPSYCLRNTIGTFALISQLTVFTMLYMNPHKITTIDDDSAVKTGSLLCMAALALHYATALCSHSANTLRNTIGVGLGYAVSFGLFMGGIISYSQSSPDQSAGSDSNFNNSTAVNFLI